MMIEKLLLSDSDISSGLVSSIDRRDAILWLSDSPRDSVSLEEMVRFISLPWKLVVLDLQDEELVSALSLPEATGSELMRKRGTVQIVEGDPARVELPPQCLPVYLIRGRSADGGSFENQLRRMTMLEQIRRSGSSDLLLVSEAAEIPQDLQALWGVGFRTSITLASSSIDAEARLKDWQRSVDGLAVVSLLTLSVRALVAAVLSRYWEVFPPTRRFVRIRDVHGKIHGYDVTDVDDPERPVLSKYDLIGEKDLAPLRPEDLSESAFVEFFQSPESSWQPFAAGLPWLRNAESAKELAVCLRKLDSAGASENCVAYIACESGAGGTTLARTLAWECARQGYPTLVAKSAPIAQDGLPLVNFMSRVNSLVNATSAHESDGSDQVVEARRYETPWVVVFDVLHWRSKESELVRFKNEFVKSGRPVCILVVTSSTLGLTFYKPGFKRVAELNHALSAVEVSALGAHLNRFLRVYGKHKEQWEWDKFHSAHNVRHIEGVSAFWVTLSFWIRGQYDLSESVQQWLYKSFCRITDKDVRDAVLEIAALSSERVSIPQALLPQSRSAWPISHLLEDSRSQLSALGLVTVSVEGTRYWALAHDILGRFLINAVFYDYELRSSLGLGQAADAEHLRFLLLKKVSLKPLLGEKEFRSIGEDFAVSLFKIDPDHGRGSFAPIWREVLSALEGMPRLLRDTSRVFRHHLAVSRRRVAKLGVYYDVSSQDRVSQLLAAVEDINYAITFIDYTPGSESDLNLFNSLANAYLDLADAEVQVGCSNERVEELRLLADAATRRAYDESPNNSFVIETYVKNLIATGLHTPAEVVDRCVEALGILFSAINSGEVAYRRVQLSDLARQTVNLLLRNAPADVASAEPKSAIDVLVQAWLALTAGGDGAALALSEVPEQNRIAALEVLAHKAGSGNLQVIHLTYDLVCLSQPKNLKIQLELAEQLCVKEYRATPQVRLEYAILLYQNGRAVEGDVQFRNLRRLWREGDHVVYVPERLRWLRSVDGIGTQAVNAVVGTEQGTRARARVQEFRGVEVPFRPEEFSLNEVRSGARLTGLVSFGHNGPFLRPLTAHTHSDQ